MSEPLKTPADRGLGHAVSEAVGCAGYRLGLTACILRHADAKPEGSLERDSSQRRIHSGLARRNLQRLLAPGENGGAAC
jgi:hypothetical protein